MPHPESYEALPFQTIRLSHNPPGTPTATPIITILLNRPGAHNAFNEQMGLDLIAAYDAVSHDPRVKCVILTSADKSNRMFCAGMDFNTKTNSVVPRPEKSEEHRDLGGQTTLASYRCNKPVIAAINGSAVGVGITMTLPANIRIASRAAKIGFVFSRRGVILEACSSFFLPRLIGTSKALHLATTGGVYPADHKLFDDLFSEVVAPEEVYPTALRLAEDIAANASSVSMRINKDLIYRGGNTPEEAHLLESRNIHQLFSGKDFGEGVASFLQKRTPNFEGTVEEDSPVGYPWWTPLDVKPKSKI